MAYIEPRGTKFIVIWREGGKKQSKGGFTTRREARIFQNEIEGRLLQGTMAHAEDRKQPLSTYARSIFEADLRIRQKTRETYLWALTKHVEPLLGHWTMEELQPARVRAALAEIHREKGPWVAESCHQVLSRVFRQALSDRLIQRNPLEGYRKPKRVKRATRILTPEEIGSIADAIEPRFRVLVLLSAWGGLRIGELGALERSDIDFNASSIAIQRAVSTPGAGSEVGPPKSEAGRRVVTLPSWVMQELREHLMAFPGPRIFTLPASDAYVTHNTIQYYWRKALERSGLEKPWPRFHDTRHTAVSVLISQGAHPKLIQSRMGHSSITMTMDTYGHLFPSADAQLAASLERFKPEEGKVIEL